MLIRKLFLLPLFALSTAVSADQLSDMKTKLESLMPGVTIDSITKLDNTGLYETTIGPDIIYFTEDGRYAIQGDVISLENRVNLTQAKRIEVKKDILANLNEEDMIIYSAKKPKYTITAFTDIDCGYCRKLHNQMQDYNDLGITIRYMAYPRAGIDSDSYEKAVNVWCAEDKQKALTDAKNDIEVVSEQCNSPVKAQMELGHRLGVEGTPILFLANGQSIPGYVPPERLKQILDEQAATL
jgi:thiol:disulfide interchange protein DsbC